jgi:ankyrin repeat protein
MKNLLCLLLPLLNSSTLLAMDLEKPKTLPVARQEDAKKEKFQEIQKHLNILKEALDLQTSHSKELFNASLNYLKNEIENPESCLWDFLGKMEGTDTFDRLSEKEKHLDLLNGDIFLKSGALDILTLWNGQGFYKDNRISVRNYIHNLSLPEQGRIIDFLGINTERLNSLNPNLDTPYMVEDNRLPLKVTKQVMFKDNITGKEEWVAKTNDRAKTDFLGLLTRFLMHTDSDDRIGAVNWSFPVKERLFGSGFIANLLIFLEKSRQSGELKGLTPVKVWETLTDPNNPKENGDTLLSGLKVITEKGMIKQIEYNDVTKSSQHSVTIIKPDKDKLASLVWDQFFYLFLGALEESGYFSKPPIYPYFLPHLVLQSFIILSDQSQAYSEVIKKHISMNDESISYKQKNLQSELLAQTLSKLKEISNKITKDGFFLSPEEMDFLKAQLGDKIATLNLSSESNLSITLEEKDTLSKAIEAKQGKIINDLKALKSNKTEETKKAAASINRHLQYALFDAKNFFDLKSKILARVQNNVDLREKYLQKGYILRYLFTNGISPQNQISNPYKVNGQTTPSYTNCVETGLFNLFGLYLPFNQNNGEIKSDSSKNGLIQEYLKKRNPKLKEFHEKFLVDQFWLPYINLKYQKGSIINWGTNFFGPSSSVLYIRVPKDSYDDLKKELSDFSSRNKMTMIESAEGIDFECFKLEHAKENHPIGHDLVFVKEDPSIVLYEVESGLMAFHLFEQMIYSQELMATPNKEAVRRFIDIITMPKIISQKFKENLKTYGLELKEHSFSSAKQLWRGDYHTIIKKMSAEEPLTLTIDISGNHTHINFTLPSIKNYIVPQDNWSMPVSLPKFFTKVFYSQTQRVRFDNFDCEHWVWLMPSILKHDTILEVLPGNSLKTLDVVLKEHLEFRDFLLPIIIKQRGILDIKNKDIDPEDPMIVYALLAFHQDGKCEIISKIIENYKTSPATLEKLFTVKDGLGDTPLHIAINNKQSEVVMILLEAFKTSPATLEKLFTIQNKSGDTPLHVAINSEQPEAVMILLEAFKTSPATLEKLFTIQNKSGNTLLHVAIKNKKLEMIKFSFNAFKNSLEILGKLFNVKNNSGLTLLHLAALYHPPTVEMYLETFKNYPDFLCRFFLRLNESIPSPLERVLAKISTSNSQQIITLYLKILEAIPFSEVFTCVNCNNENLLHLFLFENLSPEDFKYFLRVLKKHPTISQQVLDQIDNNGHTPYQRVKEYLIKNPDDPILTDKLNILTEEFPIVKALVGGVRQAAVRDK